MRPKVFESLIRDLPGHGKYFSLPDLNDPRMDTLPYCIRVLLESAVRNCDNFEVTKQDVERILDWQTASRTGSTEIAFKPSRVLLQDFTGVPAAVDLAALRDLMQKLGGDPNKINPLVPVDLVIDHSVQADFSRSDDSLAKNQEMEFRRNRERFAFLKWAAKAFSNMLIVPPGSGIVHQVNLEYLARVVFSQDGMLFPDSLVGTDSHTTMIDGLGVVGWGVGGIEAESVMLGQPISMVLPEVIGFELIGKLSGEATATDLVLTVTRMLRARGVVGKFVEFFGSGCRNLAVADRATIANMSPEFGATMGFFPVDEQTLVYLRQSGRSPDILERVEGYLRAQKMFRNYDEGDSKIRYSGETLHLNLEDVTASVAGPKRPHDHVPVTSVKDDFLRCLNAKVSFKGFGLTQEATKSVAEFTYKGNTYSLRHGSIVIAAITSCTNTSNPSVMLGSAILAKNAIEKGLGVQPYIKTTLSPGSGVVLKYLQTSGLLPYLEKLGFYMAGFGCQTCIGNSGDLDIEVADAINAKDLVACAVLSGNRNFEGRVHPLTRGNYLASPILVVAFALAGRIDIDFETEPLGLVGPASTPVFLRDIWPSREAIAQVEQKFVVPALFKECYTSIASGGSAEWQQLEVSESKLFPWSDSSTYIHNPPFFKHAKRETSPVTDIHKAYCLLNLGDSITTDHISPAGSIARNSAAAAYLQNRGVAVVDFNSYGSRRGNDEVMARGTFANIRLINKLASRPGGITRHIPSGDEMTVFDAAQRYGQEGHPLVVLAGKEYGSGSSRDWAAKGPFLQGIRAVIAQSFERIHRSNLVGMGLLPLEFLPGESVESLGLTGTERFTIRLHGGSIPVGGEVPVQVEGNAGGISTFTTRCRIDTEVELEYFKNGGILLYVLRKLL